MAQTRQTATNPVAFKRLLRLGHVAHAEGDDKQAHDYWQQAAMLQPDSEEVWMALLRVLTAEDDRRVCLRNILTINPQNKRAQEMLDELVGDTQPPNQAIVPDGSPTKNRRLSMGRLVLRVLESALLGMLIAIGMLAVRYLIF